MATVPDTDELRGTDREPRLALSLTLERTVAGLPSVAELASLIGVVTMIFELADADGALRAVAKRSQLTLQAAYAGVITELAVIEREDTPLIVTADVYASLRSWQLDGSPGEFARDLAHHRPLSALVVVEHHGHGGAPPLIISASDNGELRSWQLDGSPGELQRDDAHRHAITAVAVIDHDGAPLIVIAGRDGALRSWRLDGSPGKLKVDRAHPDWITALAVVEHHRTPLIVSGDIDGALRSWRLDGSPGELQRRRAHRGVITALAALEHDGAPLVISAGTDGALRSWRLDGSPGELQRHDARSDPIAALAAVEHDGAPLIVIAGRDGALRSWRLDGSPGELQRRRAHRGVITALAALEHDGAALVISAGTDGALRSWRLGPGSWARLGSPLAAQLEVRRVSLASPLELEVLLPAVSAVPAALGFVLYAFKRLWKFPVELRIHDLGMRTKLREAEQELERLEVTGEIDEIVEAARDAVIEAWNVLDATLHDDEENVG